MGPGCRVSGPTKSLGSRVPLFGYAIKKPFFTEHNWAAATVYVGEQLIKCSNINSRCDLCLLCHFKEEQKYLNILEKNLSQEVVTKVVNPIIRERIFSLAKVYISHQINQRYAMKSE